MKVQFFVTYFKTIYNAHISCMHHYYESTDNCRLIGPEKTPQITKKKKNRKYNAEEEEIKNMTDEKLKK